ncbi:hypothetical protein GW916_00345 [bacterium]|nr:hypothetical protein [bacterium]
MAERLSTGFVNALNVNGSVKTIMANSVIRIFSGVQPATADAAETGTLLQEITIASGAFASGSAINGLNMGVSTDGVLAKAAAEVWSGIGLAAAGTGIFAGWFRWYANTVVTGISTTAIRVDGKCGTSSTDELQLSNLLIVEGAPTTINVFNFIPAKQ